MTEETSIQNNAQRRTIQFEHDKSALVEICESLHLPPLTSDPRADRLDCKPALVDRYRRYRAQLQFRVAGLPNTCESYVVSPGMVMSVVDVGCAESVQCQLSGRDIVEFHFRISGLMLLLGNWGEMRICGPTCLLWYQSTGCDDTAARFGIQSAVRERWVSLYCDRTWLRDTGGPPAAALLDGFARGNAPFSTPKFRTYGLGQMMPILEDIFGMTQRDRPDWLIMIAKAHELLYLALRNVQFLEVGQLRVPRVPEQTRRRVAMARKILFAEFITPPPLQDLARRVGLTSSRLCSDFKLLFGETISSFVRRQRLELALKLLTTSDFQVRAVARKIGYGHHATFTAAFVRHFGITPKFARKNSS